VAEVKNEYGDGSIFGDKAIHYVWGEIKIEPSPF
jgi:hypothetical protein